MIWLPGINFGDGPLNSGEVACFSWHGTSPHPTQRKPMKRGRKLAPNRESVTQMPNRPVDESNERPLPHSKKKKVNVLTSSITSDKTQKAWAYLLCCNSTQNSFRNWEKGEAKKKVKIKKRCKNEGEEGGRWKRGCWWSKTKFTARAEEAFFFVFFSFPTKGKIFVCRRLFSGGGGIENCFPTLPPPLFRRFLGPGISRVPQFEEEEGGRGCQNGGCIIPLSVSAADIFSIITFPYFNKVT